jgi:hypothetical protein
MLDWLKIPVDFKTLLIDVSSLETTIVNAKEKAKYIVVSNMGTKPCLALLITQIITQNSRKHQLKNTNRILMLLMVSFHPFSNNNVINFDNPKSAPLHDGKNASSALWHGVFICKRLIDENVPHQRSL